MAPEIKVCSADLPDLTAGEARKRIDSALAGLEKMGNRSVLANKALSGADSRTVTPAHRYLIALALEELAHLKSENGERFFALEEISHAAQRADDRKIGLETVRLRADLLREKTADDRWVRWTGHTGTTEPVEQLWWKTIQAAASFGDAKLALALMGEGLPDIKTDTHDYFWRLAHIRNLAGEYAAAETAALRAQELEPEEWPVDSGTDRVVADFELIRSLAGQGKDYKDAGENLKNGYFNIPASLSGHTDNLLYAAWDMADWAPQFAHDFAKAGRNVTAAIGADYLDIRQVGVCAEIMDDACLLEIGQRLESNLASTSDGSVCWAAIPYAFAGDTVSVRRLLGLLNPSDSYNDHYCQNPVRTELIKRLITDGRLDEAELWLNEWALHLSKGEANFDSGWGFGGNRWSWVAGSYAQLARAQAAKGMAGAARDNAETALVLAIQTELDWAVEFERFRAETFGYAYGAAFSALSAAAESIPSAQ